MFASSNVPSFDDGWVGGTFALLIGAAVLASEPAAWPAFVAAVLAAGSGLFLLWRRDVLSTRAVLLGAVALRAVYFPLGPGLSDDMFRYVWDGWLQWEGINPYRYAPADAPQPLFRDAELYSALNSKDYYSVYPPLSQIIFWIGTGLGSGTQGGYYAIKLLFGAMEMAGVGLLSRLTSARNVLLYAWNPLVLVEGAGQGHTEAAAVLFILLAVWAVRSRRGRTASLAVAAAGLVKLYPLVLGPYLLRRFGWRAVWPGALLTATVSLPYAAPYVLPHMKASVDLYVHLFEFNAGPYYMVKQAFSWATGADWSKQIGPAFRGLFLASLPILYGMDARRDWSFVRAARYTLGLFFVLSTTVHPWYLLPLLPLAVLCRQPAWSWLWLGLMSVGTYLFYIDGPYLLWVALGWGGAALLAGGRRLARSGRLQTAVHHLLNALQRRRAETKAHRIIRLLQRPEAPVSSPPVSDERVLSDPEGGPGADSFGGPFHRRRVPRGRSLRILDLGAGEGYVGAALKRKLDADVHLADVVDLNRTDLPHRVYDGRRLPIEDAAVDVTVLYFVLHHARDPEAVLREALRVARGRVVVVESVVTGPWQHRILRFLDRQVNRLRSRGRMRTQEAHLSLRPARDWADLARRVGARIVHHRVRRHPVHPQAFYVLEPPAAPAASASAGEESAGEESAADGGADASEAARR